MTIKQILFSTLILGTTANIAFGTEKNSSNINLYTYGSDHTLMIIDFLNGIRSRGSVYDNDSIVINKDHSGKISAHHIGDLKSIENAFITYCSGFKVIEHGANNRNEALCNNASILKAYDQFRKNNDKK